MVHLSWQTVTLLWIGALFVIMLPTIIRLFTEKSCKRCYYPQSKCACKPDCGHTDKFEPIQAQHGWIAKCKDCGEIVYLGDD